MQTLCQVYASIFLHKQEKRAENLILLLSSRCPRAVCLCLWRRDKKGERERRERRRMQMHRLERGKRESGKDTSLLLWALVCIFNRLMWKHLASSNSILGLKDTGQDITAIVCVCVFYVFVVIDFSWILGFSGCTIINNGICFFFLPRVIIELPFIV